MPLIWTCGEVSSVFQSQGGQPYSHLSEAYMLPAPFGVLVLLSFVAIDGTSIAFLIALQW